MKPFMIAMATAASLAGATLIGAEAHASPKFGGPGGFKAGPMKPVGPGGFKPGGFKPGGFKHGGVKPGGFKPSGFKHGPGKLAMPHKPGKGGGAWKHPHKPGHGHLRRPHWGHGYGWGAAGLAYFASPIYVGAYETCDWVRIKTRHGLRWRPYC